MLLSILAASLFLSNALASRLPRERRAFFDERDKAAQWLQRRDDDTAGVSEATFDQLIDHTNPSLGTFKQRYLYSTPYYGGEGHPIVFLGPGGDGLDDTKFWLHDNYTIEGMIAYRTGGALVMLEDRYQGQSSPVSSYTTDKLALLTEEQLMQDRIYFAKNVELPFAKSGSASPDKVPWINSGCSSGGNRAIYTEREYGGTFWATWASSAPVEGIQDFWRYFDAAKTYVAKNCTADVKAVIEHLDGIMDSGSADDIKKIKEMFGAGELTENADFMNLLSNGPQTFQSASVNTHELWTFCDYVENSVNQTDKSKLPGAEGVGLDKALAGYAQWVKEYFLTGIGSCATQGFEGSGASCYNLLDPKSSAYAAKKTTDSTATYASWQDTWVWCNEALQQWQTGSPAGTPTLVSRLVNVDYYLKLCANTFPPGPKGETYGLAKGVTVGDFNAKHGGWSDPTSSMKNIIIVSGAEDPWTAASYASPQRPGGVFGSTDKIKHLLNSKGNHCTDTYRNAGEIWPEVAAVQSAGIEQIVDWIAQFPKPKLSS